ncbi:hypothetical protein ACFL1H_04870 [Nanoarchaeota archaeon]
MGIEINVDEEIYGRTNTLTFKDKDYDYEKSIIIEAIVFRQYCGDYIEVEDKELFMPISDEEIEVMSNTVSSIAYPDPVKVFALLDSIKICTVPSPFSGDDTISVVVHYEIKDLNSNKVPAFLINGIYLERKFEFKDWKEARKKHDILLEYNQNLLHHFEEHSKLVLETFEDCFVKKRISPIEQYFLYIYKPDLPPDDFKNYESKRDKIKKELTENFQKFVFDPDEVYKRFEELTYLATERKGNIYGG